MRKKKVNERWWMMMRKEKRRKEEKRKKRRGKRKKFRKDDDDLQDQNKNSSNNTQKYESTLFAALAPGLAHSLITLNSLFAFLSTIIAYHLHASLLMNAYDCIPCNHTDTYTFNSYGDIITTLNECPYIIKIPSFFFDTSRSIADYHNKKRTFRDSYSKA